MIQDFFTPVSDTVLKTNFISKSSLGNQIQKHSKEFGFPDLAGVNICFFDVREERNTLNNQGTSIGSDEIRHQLYQLYSGNWQVSIADLGFIQAGSSPSDTYYAVQQSILYLIKNKILPIIIGGGQDLIYANYKAYEKLEQAVNLAVISPKFGFGNTEKNLNDNYLSKIVLEESCYLFNYANLGYQTYYNTPEEIALIEKLNFEAYRLGNLKNITTTEPIMRDADIVSIDIGAVKFSEAPANANANPNGFSGSDICAIARYAGLSDKATSFGIYEYNQMLDIQQQTSKLISQVIWYFIEGYSLRKNDYPYGSKETYLKHLIPFENQTLSFYQSDKSQRWWMQITTPTSNKHSKHMLIPCSYQDYLNTINQQLPERLLIALKKML